MSVFLTVFSAVILSSLLVDETSVIEVCGFQFTEGPLWVEKEGWIFSDIPANTVYKLDHTPFLSPSGNSNGLALDKGGKILLAEHGNRRISRLGDKGVIEVVADKYEGKRFNSPNDLTVRSDGTIFFTDPTFGLQGGLEGPNAELDFCGVYAISHKGKVSLITKDLKLPNGIALSCDEKVLYVADTAQNAIYKFSNLDGDYPLEAVKFCDVPSPDGMKVDKRDNIWVASSDGIVVFSKKGEKVETIKIPKQPSNCAFGGKEGNEFFVTARECVYKFELKKSDSK